MFDDIEVNSDYPLLLPNSPRGFIRQNNFQTKDLGSCMDTYKIDASGQLFIVKDEREYTEGDPNGKTFKEKFGTVKILHEWWEKLYNYDTIFMYTSWENETNRYWIEYRVQFVNGKIDDIIIFRFDVKDESTNTDDILKRIFGQEEFDI